MVYLPSPLVLSSLRSHVLLISLQWDLLVVCFYSRIDELYFFFHVAGVSVS